MDLKFLDFWWWNQNKFCFLYKNFKILIIIFIYQKISSLPNKKWTLKNPSPSLPTTNSTPHLRPLFTPPPSIQKPHSKINNNKTKKLPPNRTSISYTTKKKIKTASKNNSREINHSLSRNLTWIFCWFLGMKFTKLILRVFCLKDCGWKLFSSWNKRKIFLIFLQNIKFQIFFEICRFSDLDLPDLNNEVMDKIENKITKEELQEISSKEEFENFIKSK